MCNTAKQLDEVDQEYFRELIEIVEEHSDWKFDSQFGATLQQAVTQAATSSGPTIGELRYKHTETEGELYIRLPSLGTSTGVMKIYLEQPLDPKLDQIDSDLAEKLGDTYQQIVKKHATQYISAEATPYTILSVAVPVDYCPNELVVALDAVSTVSTQITELHKEVKGLITSP